MKGVEYLGTFGFGNGSVGLADDVRAVKVGGDDFIALTQGTLTRTFGLGGGGVFWTLELREAVPLAAGVLGG